MTPIETNASHSKTAIELIQQLKSHGDKRLFYRHRHTNRHTIWARSRRAAQKAGAVSCWAKNKQTCTRGTKKARRFFIPPPSGCFFPSRLITSGGIKPRLHHTIRQSNIVHSLEYRLIFVFGTQLPTKTLLRELEGSTVRAGLAGLQTAVFCG